MKRRQFLTCMAALMTRPAFGFDRVCPPISSAWKLANMPMPVSVNGAGIGSVRTDKRAIDAVWELYSGPGARAIYVDPVYGADSASNGSETSPVKTLAYALQSRTEKHVFLIPNGPFAPCDLSFTHAGAGYNVRRVAVAPGYRSACIARAVDSLGSLSWSHIGGGVYQASVTSATPNQALGILHVYRRNQFNQFNEPQSVRRFLSLAELQAAGAGWFYDNAARKIYLANGGEDIQASRSVFVAIGSAQMTLSGARIVFDGNIIFDGVPIVANEASGQVPIVCFSGTKHRFSHGHSIQVNGGICLSEDVMSYGGAYDGWNYNRGASVNTFAMEINCRGYGAGNLDAWGAEGEENRNGSSAHGGCDIVRFGGMYDGNFGPNINDTSIESFGAISWNVGVMTRNSRAALLNRGLASDGTASGGRMVWLDGCVDIDAVDAGIYAKGEGNLVKVNGCSTFGAGTLVEGDATVSTYSLADP